MELEIVKTILFGGGNGTVTEEYLAEKFKVSRTPIRELLNQLQRDGLLVRRNKKGTMLRIPERSEMIDIMEIRELLESYAMRKAIEKMTPDRIRKLERLALKYENCLENNDLVGAEKADLSFHLNIVKFSGNRHLAKISENSHMIVKCFTLGRYFYFKKDRKYKDINPYRHKNIVDALRSGNAHRAASIIRKHIHSGSKRMLQTFTEES